MATRKHFGLPSTAVFLALVAANLLYYHQLVANAFFGNDLIFIQAVQDLPSPAAAFTLAPHRAIHEGFPTYHFRPLQMVLLYALKSVFGTDFLPWHAFMLAMHTLTACLALVFLARFLPPGLAAGAAFLWSLGWYKADSVSWLAGPHMYSTHLMLWLLVLSPLVRGYWGVAVRVLLMSAAVLFHETAWLFAPLIILEGTMLRRGPRGETAALTAALAVLAAGSALLYLRIARSTPAPALPLSPSAVAANYPALVASLAAPFQLGFNGINRWLANHGGWKLTWLGVLVPFYSAVLLATALAIRSRPDVPGRAMRDPVLLWGFGWMALGLVPNALLESWLHGRYIYAPSLGLALGIGRLLVLWRSSPSRPARARRQAMAALALLLASQALFGLKLNAHMVRGYREIAAMLGGIRAAEPPPRPGETWIVARYPWDWREVRAFLRHIYGKAPKLTVLAGDPVEYPPRPYRLLYYDSASVSISSRKPPEPAR